MGEAVKSIFKMLIKIPIIIFISFFIFNIVSFGVCYFKMLGLSYIVEQTAIENNYIPNDDRVTIENYMESMHTDMLQNIRFTDNTTFERKQYGETVQVGVQADFVWIWPLITTEQMEGKVNGVKVAGSEGVIDNESFGGWKSEAELESTRQNKKDSADSDIKIDYSIPGLKFYPDME